MAGAHVYRTPQTPKLQGKLRQKTKGAYYHYRLTIADGTRKEFTLKTRDYKEALKKASELDSIWLAPTKEVALAQVPMSIFFTLSHCFVAIISHFPCQKPSKNHKKEAILIEKL